MANRFPLIVNPTTKKIEELVGGDNLNLTDNGLVANNSLGNSGQYLKTNGSTVVWDNPGDVYLTTAQTITNKTIESSFISGATNTFSSIPNSALVNNSITVNGVAISLGGSVTTPNDNTTYSVSAVDGAANQKLIRLTSGGNFGSGVTDDVAIAVAPYAGTLPANHKVANLYIERSGDQITLSASAEDRDTITRVSAEGGTLVTGNVVLKAGAFTTLSQSGQEITIIGQDTNTVTRITENVSGSGSLVSGDVTLAAGSTNLTIAQSGNTFTFNSLDTITRVRATGASGGSFTSGDISFTPGTNVQLTQVGSTITVSSTDTNTVTSVRGTSGGTYVSGNVTLEQAGAVTITQGTGANSGIITISATDTNTTYNVDGTGGLSLSGTNFSLKNIDNILNQKILKWDEGNNQVTNSIISDDGSTVTVAGDLVVTGATTTIQSQTLVIEDNIIEMRRGQNITGSDGGIQVNRTTNALGLVTSYSSLLWTENGGYWRTYDGSVSQRLVTEGETQTLTNKTLTSPTLTTPNIGVATATTINGLAISQVVSGTLTIANNKTFTANNSLTIQGTDNSTISFGTGGTVVYTSNRIDSLSTTTSAQLAGKISDEVGTGGRLMFNLSPQVQTSLTTNSTTFDLIDTTATTVNFAGAATTLHIGSGRPATPQTPANTVRIFGSMKLQCDGSVILGDSVGDLLTVNSTATFVNADIRIQGIDVGRGGNQLSTNTRVGENALYSITSGTQNTALGYEAGLTLNSGAGNVALGTNALRSAGTATYNIAVGRDALYADLTGSKNVAVGANTLYSNSGGGYNVCIGHYAGSGATGSGNVLIGAADDENDTNSTYRPPTPAGDRQLVIGSGTGTWIRGDSGFNVQFLNDVGVGGDLAITGNLTVNGLTTTLNTNTLTVDDKLIDLGNVENTTFTANVTNGDPTVSNVSSFANVIPGMVVSISTGGISVPVGTKILSIDSVNETITLDNNVSGSSGSATFNVVGPSDTSADGGGIRLLGTTDKYIKWFDATDAWTSSEHFDLASGKQYRVGNVTVVNGTTSTLGPTTGTWSLGAGVTGSSLTSVGTLTSLTVTGATVTGDLTVSATSNLKQITETVANAFNTSLAPSTGTLTVDTSVGTVVLGDLNASVTTWAFTNVPTANSKATTITLIIDGDTAQTYGDACNVNGSAVSGGVKWAGGSAPTATNNFDIITFTIVKDSAGTINVFGSGNTDFS
jgi:hypothetical protein